MALKIFLHLSDDLACTVYRAKMPMLHLYDDLSLHGIHIIGDKKPLKYEDFDICIFNRLLRPPAYSETVLPMLQLGKKFVWQCDDDLWNIPEWNPASKLFDANDLCATDLYIKACIALWVSTDNMVELVGFPEKTKVLPNLIDRNQYEEEIIHEKPIKIVWCGSGSHDKDLEVIVKPLAKILEKYGSKVGAIFWGYFPTGLSKFERYPGHPHASLIPKYDNLFFGEWFSNREYYHKLRFLKPDIAIMPLEDCRFNYSKSNLKYLEMSMAGAACIATNLPPYQCVVNKETGLLVQPNDEQGWFDAMDELIQNKEYRLKLNANARDQIKEKYSWQSSARQLWLQAFLDLAAP